MAPSRPRRGRRRSGAVSRPSSSSGRPCCGRACSTCGRRACSWASSRRAASSRSSAPSGRRASRTSSRGPWCPRRWASRERRASSQTLWRRVLSETSAPMGSRACSSSTTTCVSWTARGRAASRPTRPRSRAACRRRTSTRSAPALDWGLRRCSHPARPCLPPQRLGRSWQCRAASSVVVGPGCARSGAAIAGAAEERGDCRMV
mmetsp:Transcript_91766/g.268592  ORF Transcript_91766/g.268592 Transcript_91766/m.268592 type:complete len:204 (-) Transcript_91766:95-706(-)